MNLFITRQLAGTATLMVVVGAVSAGSISQVPLTLSSDTDPNIMFLIDSSGSMQNIVPDSPYDSSTTYECSGTAIAAGASIDIRVGSDGVPYFNDGSSDYDWGTPGVDLALPALNVRCFVPASNYNARLYGESAAAPYVPEGYLAAQYTGNYLNWYFGSDVAGTNYGSSSPDWGTGTIRNKPLTERRMEIAQSTANNLIGSLSDVRVGLATYSGIDGAEINIGVADIASNSAPMITAINAISPNDATPLAEALLDIGRYFVGQEDRDTPIPAASSLSQHDPLTSCTVNGQYTGSFTLHPDGTPATKTLFELFEGAAPQMNSVDLESPICHYCQKNFVILLTDGRPTQDQTIPTPLEDYDGDCAGASPACDTHDRKGPATNYEDDSLDPSDYLDDVAKALYEIDLRPDIDDANGDEIVNNIVTYTIGFADAQVINDPLMQDTATNGGGEFLAASNAGALSSALNAAINDIQEQISSASALTASSTRLDTSTFVFQSLFNSGNWSGQLLAKPVNSNGTLGTEAWDAAAQIPAHGSRNIVSWDSATSAGFDFNVTNISTILASIATIDDDEVNYLRGDTRKELQSGGTLRNRPVVSGAIRVLGDIINSNPVFVSHENFGYEKLGGSLGSAYAAFRSTTSYANRKPMIYVGANDGMLHGFYLGRDTNGDNVLEADTDTTQPGAEVLAYIPKAVYSNLESLTESTYSHKYFVDGSPHVGDAYIDPDGDPSIATTKAWRSVLVSTTGAGGKGVFALDVTTPSSFSAANVLWEVDDTTTTDDFSDMGTTIGEVTIVGLENGQWAAVFANGYNSSTGKAVIYVVDLEDGSIIKSFDSLTTGNGMSTPVAVDTDGNLKADTIYAGDLKGNLWKIDISSSSASQWDFSHPTSGPGNPEPLFIATNGIVQPITAKPQVGKHSDGGFMVYFGTGKYYETGDNDVPVTPQIQTFYGIRDHSDAQVNSDRTELVAQTILAEDTAFGFKIRVTSDTAAGVGETKGWYLNLQSPSTNGQGERVINAPILRGDRVLFTT
ncbi:MAG: PilC/PilY family type IV pilus protein, partial [Motiliproteus sp.]